jgi:hypothetical protein
MKGIRGRKPFEIIMRRKLSLPLIIGATSPQRLVRPDF